VIEDVGGFLLVALEARDSALSAMSSAFSSLMISRWLRMISPRSSWVMTASAALVSSFVSYEKEIKIKRMLV
jgi:hypothetical protein